MRKLLIIIDAQIDFIDGALANPAAQAAIPTLVKLIKNHEGDVIATHDTHFTDEQCGANWPPASNVLAYPKTLEGSLIPPHCIKGTDGYELNDAVADACVAKNDEPPKNFFAIDKYTFGWDEWKKYLSTFEFDEIEIAGFCTDICVISNALILRALYPNMPITCIGNACAGLTPEKHEAALSVMQSCEINVKNI